MFSAGGGGKGKEGLEWREATGKEGGIAAGTTRDNHNGREMGKLLHYHDCMAGNKFWAHDVGIFGNELGGRGKYIVFVETVFSMDFTLFAFCFACCDCYFQKHILILI